VRRFVGPLTLFVDDKHVMHLQIDECLCRDSMICNRERRRVSMSSSARAFACYARRGYVLLSKLTSALLAARGLRIQAPAVLRTCETRFVLRMWLITVLPKTHCENFENVNDVSIKFVIQRTACRLLHRERSPRFPR